MTLTLSPEKVGPWVDHEILEHEQVNKIASELVKAIDGVGGGAYNPSANITLGGAGELRIDNVLRVLTGADLFGLLADPDVRRGVQELLGLPAESVSDALRDLAKEVKALAAAQRQTDVEIKALATAQRQTDTELKALATEVKTLAAEVKALAASMDRGFTELRKAVASLSVASRSA